MVELEQPHEISVDDLLCEQPLELEQLNLEKEESEHPDVSLEQLELIDEHESDRSLDIFINENKNKFLSFDRSVQHCV